MNSLPPYACQLDHLVVAAASCEQGVAWMHQRSGVHMPFGGEHPLMGTHNHLTALSANQFLEIIAINPEAPAPACKRWFSLDDVLQQSHLQISPRLTTWVVATHDLDSALLAVRAVGIDPGIPVTSTRGNLQWRLALRPDGSLAFDGAFPILIEWPTGVNPVDQMQDQGVRLDRLDIVHPNNEHLSRALDAIGIASLASVSQGPTRLNAMLSVGNRSFILN